MKGINLQMCLNNLNDFKLATAKLLTGDLLGEATCIYNYFKPTR